MQIVDKINKCGLAVSTVAKTAIIKNAMPTMNNISPLID
jgi:hypothetical protein